MKRQPTLFDGVRLTIRDSIRLTVESLLAYGSLHQHWAIAWSGGKDSSTVATLVLWLLESGQIATPQSLTVLYADTRLELTPLALAAQAMITQMRSRGVDVRIVLPALDDRFFVYMLGRGVPPPNNRTLRWCTPQIKIEPMQRELQHLVGGLGESVLMLTGVRLGESAVRDQRIALSCSRDGAECGQGWYQHALPESLCSTLAPILHWRVCHVWDWLRIMAPSPKYGGWATAEIADAYGGDEAEEVNARTGCVGCPLASKDTALDGVLAQRKWAYLAPLKELRPLYSELRRPNNRLRKPGGERRKDGTLSRNQNRMGPLTLEARRSALAQVLDIQARVNAVADRLERPRIDILDDQERQRIEALIEAGTWPQKWTGEESRGDEPYVSWAADGTRQATIFGE